MTDSKQAGAALVDGLDVEITRVVPEAEVIAELLDLDGKQILNLDYNHAVHTRSIAEAGRGCEVLALEIDERQHLTPTTSEDVSKKSHKAS